MIRFYAWKEMSRRKGRTFLSVAGMVISTTLLVAVLAIARAVQEAASEPLEAVGADLVIINKVEPCPFSQVKRPKDLGPIPASLVEEIRGLPGVQEASGSLELWAFGEAKPDLEGSPPNAPGALKGQATPIVVTGLPPGDQQRKVGPLRPFQKGEKCCSLAAGRYFGPEEPNACLLSQDFAASRGLRVGDTLPIAFEEFQVVGLVQTQGLALIGHGQAFIPLQTAQEMLAEGDIVTHLFIKLQPGADPRPIEARARAVIGPGTQVTTESALPSQVGGLAALAQATVKMIAGLVVFLVAILVIKSAISAVGERVQEIGIMKAVGWRQGHILQLLGTEMALQGLVGAALGCGLGYTIAAFYARYANLTLPNSLNSFPDCAQTPPPVALTVTVGPSAGVLATAVGVTLLMALTAGLLAGRRAARLDPAQALRQL